MNWCSYLASYDNSCRQGRAGWEQGRAQAEEKLLITNIAAIAQSKRKENWHALGYRAEQGRSSSRSRDEDDDEDEGKLGTFVAPAFPFIPFPDVPFPDVLCKEVH